MSFFDKCKIEFLPETLSMKVISDEEYFSSEYKQYISNTKLKLINPDEGGTPKLYQEGLKFDYNPSIEFGSIIHQLLLQPEEYILKDYDFKPSAKLGLFVDYVIQFRKEGLSIYDSMYKASEKANYYKGKLTPRIIQKAIESGLQYYLDSYKTDLFKPVDGKIPIVTSKKVKDSCLKCLDSLKETKEFDQYLYEQNISDSKIFKNEEALFIDIKITLPDGKSIVLPFKCKLDNYTIDPDTKEIILNDLKTTSKLVNSFMGYFIEEDGEDKFINGSFQKFHYYRQLAVYMLILQLYTKQLGYKGYTYKTNILAVESQPLYNSKVYSVNQSYIKEGLKEFKELMCRVAYHTIYGFDVELNLEDYE